MKQYIEVDQTFFIADKKIQAVPIARFTGMIKIRPCSGCVFYSAECNPVTTEYECAGNKREDGVPVIFRPVFE